MFITQRLRTKLLLSIVFVASLFVLPGIALRSVAQEGEAETWYGVLDLKKQHLRLVVELTPAESSSAETATDAPSWTGKLRSLDEGGVVLPLETVTRNDDVFEFTIKISKTTYKGTLSAKRDLVEGKWLQKTASIPLSFRRVDEVPEPKLKAVWKGTIKVLFQTLDLQFRELESGQIYFESLTENVGGIVATKTTEDDVITIDVPAVKGKFIGKLSEDGKKLEGKWTQGFLSPKLVLERASVASSGQARNRPQTPQPPFPYLAEAVSFKNEAAQVTLAGTLTKPKGEGPFPAVVLITGSGPQDRDETIEGHKPFLVIADHFTRQGIAVLRYDERGVGKSTGKFETATSVDFAADAKAAVEFLREQTSIDPTQVGLCGHSEGGYVAPMIAAHDSEIAFIVMMAGSAVPGDDILVSQLALILEASGVDADMVARRSKSQRALVDLVKHVPRLSNEEFEQRANEAIRSSLTDEELDLDVDKAMLAAAKTQLRTPWFEYFTKYDPRSDLRKVACPVLAINGSKDLQVDPKLNLPELRKALEQAPTTEFTVKELPGLNHLFQQAKTGLIQEYGGLEQTFDPRTLELMSAWILENVK